MSDNSKKLEEIHAQMNVLLPQMTATVTDAIEKQLAAMRTEGLDDWDRRSVGRRYAEAFTRCANISLGRSGHAHDVGDEFYDVGEIKSQRNELLEIVENLIDAWRAGDSLDPLLADARLHVGEMLHYGENFDDIFTPALKRQIDKWIDNFGTAPPGLHPSNLECWKEEPHPNPPKRRDP